MAWYRVLVELAAHPPVAAGTVSQLEEIKPEARERLLGAGRIAPVAFPPLELIWPGWAEELKMNGIETAEQLLDAGLDPAMEADLLNYVR